MCELLAIIAVAVHPPDLSGRARAQVEKTVVREPRESPYAILLACTSLDFRALRKIGSGGNPNRGSCLLLRTGQFHRIRSQTNTTVVIQIVGQSSKFRVRNRESP